MGKTKIVFRPKLRKVKLYPFDIVSCKLTNGETVNLIVSENDSLTLSVNKEYIDGTQKTNVNVYSDRVWLPTGTKMM
jgi:hypothetical protein